MLVQQLWNIWASVSVDGQIWNAAYLSSGTNQMVLAPGGLSFVTYKVQSAVAKMVIYDRKVNTPAWCVPASPTSRTTKPRRVPKPPNPPPSKPQQTRYTNLGSYVFFHNSSTTGLASSFQPGNVTQNISWQLDMCPASNVVSVAACPCFSGTFTFQCPAAGTVVGCPDPTNSAPWSFTCTAGSYKAFCASSCALCPAGTFNSETGSVSAASCRRCPGGHYCPVGTSSWARLNCGRGNYCPDGSGAPTPCPLQVPPTSGWGALQVQGPAFLVETAHCLNHCFWNFTSGDGMLSKC